MSKFRNDQITASLHLALEYYIQWSRFNKECLLDVYSPLITGHTILHKLAIILKVITDFDQVKGDIHFSAFWSIRDGRPFSDFGQVKDGNDFDEFGESKIMTTVRPFALIYQYS